MLTLLMVEVSDLMSLPSAVVKLPRSPVDFQTILGASGQFLRDFLK